MSQYDIKIGLSEGIKSFALNKVYPGPNLCSSIKINFISFVLPFFDNAEFTDCILIWL